MGVFEQTVDYNDIRLYKIKLDLPRTKKIDKNRKGQYICFQ